MTRRALRETAVDQDDGAGNGEIRFGPIPGGQAWDIRAIAISTTSGAATTATIFIRAEGTDWFLDSTGAGNGAVSDWTSLFLPPGLELVIRWTGMTVGSRAQAMLLGFRESFESR